MLVVSKAGLPCSAILIAAWLFALLCAGLAGCTSTAQPPEITTTALPQPASGPVTTPVTATSAPAASHPHTMNGPAARQQHVAATRPRTTQLAGQAPARAPASIPEPQLSEPARLVTAAAPAVSDAHPIVSPQAVLDRAPPQRPLQGLVTEFTLAQVTVYDRPYGQRIGTINEQEFPRTGNDASGTRGVPIYAVDGGVIEVALPGGKTGWINKAAAVTTVPPCQSVAPVRSAPGKGGHVARGAGEGSC